MNKKAFDYLELKRSSAMQDFEDEELVKLVQNDIDTYRNQCHWECLKCSYKINYKNSLKNNKEKYIHDLKCPNKNKKSICKSKMKLISNNDQAFDSKYFNEIFARYQDKIISESIRCNDFSDPGETYSILCGLFMKIVGKFARKDEFKKTSNKWFSTYFWSSVKNKISDIKKTNNYQKRSPLVVCAICGNKIGEITSAHLSKPGHEIILNKIIENIGEKYLYQSGEIKYYLDLNLKEELLLRSKYIGRTMYDNLKDNEKKDLFKMECFSAYSNLYPNHMLKNNLMSINSLVSEDSDTEFQDMHSHLCENDLLEKINFERILNKIIKLIIEPSLKQLDRMFVDKIDDKNKIFIIKRVLENKIFYNNLSNKKIDNMFSEVKKGFTSKIISFLKENEKFYEILDIKNNHNGVILT